MPPSDESKLTAVIYGLDSMRKELEALAERAHTLAAATVAIRNSMSGLSGHSWRDEDSNG